MPTHAAVPHEIPDVDAATVRVPCGPVAGVCSEGVDADASDAQLLEAAFVASERFFGSCLLGSCVFSSLRASGGRF